MSRQINQPINQVKLTNVAVVRINKAGKRFEIACYRNKVMDYRSGLETDLSEVLQTERIFTNVSKGQFAKSADLKKAFGTTDDEAIAKVILEEGKSIQVSDLERNQQIQSTLAQIASWVASNCVHPDNGRPYTVSQIKHALGKNFTVHLNASLKKQCLDAVKFLKNEIPIERAKMELSIEYDTVHQETVSQAMDQMEKQIVSENKSPQTSSCIMVLRVDPSLYRELDELSKTVGGQLEILQQVVSVEGDVDLEAEMARKQAQIKESTKAQVAPKVVDTIVDQVNQLNLNRSEVDSEPSPGHGDDHENESADKHSEGKVEDDDDLFPPKMDRKSLKKASKKAKKAQRRVAHEQDGGTVDGAGSSNDNAMEVPRSNSNNTSTTSVPGSTPIATGAKTCNTCGGGFVSTADYRAHFRSDWHRFNQKLKLQGRDPVSEEEFRLCDAETFFGSFDS